MSYTEMIAFDKDGNAFVYAEIRNSWRSAPAIWGEMEKRYLPRYVPSWLPPEVSRNQYLRMTEDEIARRFGYVATRSSSFGDNKGMQEVWDLHTSAAVKDGDRIALLSTLDGCIAKEEDFGHVGLAFLSFGGTTSLPDQSNVLHRMMEDENVIACAWNQTSVCADTWRVQDEDAEDGVRPYNLFRDTGHWYIRDEESEDTDHDN